MTSRDERVLILQLLREGKITPEEAERLLRALTPKETSRREPFFFDHLFERLEDEFRAFGERLRHHFENVFGEGRERSSSSEEGSGPVELPEGVFVRASHTGGDLFVGASGDRRLRVTAPEWHLHVAEDEPKAELSTAGGPTRILLPAQTRRLAVESAGGSLTLRGVRVAALSARVMGGSATLEEVAADVEVEVLGGGANVKGVCGKAVEVRVSGGSVHAELGVVRQGSYAMTALGGDLHLSLEEESNFEVEYSLSGGFLSSEWEGEAVGACRLRVGAGSAKFRLTATGGGIRLLRGKGKR